ncbi:MAG: MoaD/ThiS family protein [Bacteroidia bacterium]|nr:MoaD/ThiS family protein [Bacteroidia bacterium]
MMVNIKYFGLIAEITNCGSESIVINKDSTLADVNKILNKKYEKLNTVSYRIAMGNSLCENDQAILENEEIALLPPFAGG